MAERRQILRQDPDQKIHILRAVDGNILLQYLFLRLVQQLEADRADAPLRGCHHTEDRFLSRLDLDLFF